MCLMAPEHRTKAGGFWHQTKAGGFLLSAAGQGDEQCSPRGRDQVEQGAADTQTTSVALQRREQGWASHLGIPGSPRSRCTSETSEKPPLVRTGAG